MPVKIFFCYAHEDEELLNKLKAHLKPLEQQGLIVPWHDRDINAGTEWEREIDKHLNTAQIILLLVSPDFMASDYCYSIEVKRAIERHDRGEAQVIPVILRHVYWQGEPLGKLQALPKDAKPVTDPTWHNLDMAFLNITEGIRKVIISKQPPPPLPKLKHPEPPPVDPKVMVQAQQLDLQVFGELKTFYPWLSDNQLALLQGVYQTWRQLAEANPEDLHRMLSGVPLPPKSPGITSDQVYVILAFARAKV